MPLRLLFAQDTTQDTITTQNSDLQQNLEGDLITISKKTKDMSPKSAANFVDDAVVSWREADPYPAVSDTTELIHKWYNTGTNLMDSFAAITEIWAAQDLLVELLKIQDQVERVRSKSEKMALQSREKEIRAKLDILLPSLPQQMQNAEVEQQEKIADGITGKFDHYIVDSDALVDRWVRSVGNIEAERKKVDVINQLSAIHLQGRKVDIMKAFDKVVQATPPTLPAEFNDSPNVVQGALKRTLDVFTKVFTEFSTLYQNRLDELGRVLGQKAFSKNLF